MKLTDFSLVFLSIVLPIILIVYVNVSFSINAFNEEMHYTKLINAATQDATAAMKEVESLDPDNDYGYSGEFDNKVSINPTIAVDAFYDSLYTNLGISKNKGYQMYLDMHIPFLGIIDYNGIYICRLQKINEGDQLGVEKIITPKRYFSYMYKVKNDDSIVYEEDTNFDSDSDIKSIHNIEFTLDDRITHNGCYKEDGKWKDYSSKTFFIADGKNNMPLILNENEIRYDINVSNEDLEDENVDELIERQETIFKDIVNHLKEKRKEVIIDVILKEINYSINSLNNIAMSEGIAYNFSVPTITTEEMDKYIGNIGVVSFVQGLRVGNKYLEYKGYGSKDLNLTRKYFLTEYTENSKFNMNLYHKTKKCPEYKVSNSSKSDTYYKIRAAKEGYFPCPICKP